MAEFISGLNPLLAVFLIAALGYLIGGIKIAGIELGTAGVLIVALVFGHFGSVMPALVRNLGLALFVTSVGFIAGPKFFRNFRQNAKNYILLGFVIILVGAVSTWAIIRISGIGPELAAGLMTGALTSTPGLSAAMDAAGNLKDLVTVGYAIAYPFGVVGVVLFVQLMPKILRVDMKKELETFQAANLTEVKPIRQKLILLDREGLFSFALVVVLGILLGSVTVPLGGGAHFSLGTTGGPLITALIFGHFGHVGPIDLRVKKPALEMFRELGLMLFLIGAGTEGGKSFVSKLREEGAMLFVYGAIITILPMIVGYFLAARTLKLSLLNNLGSITGGMTSTPALGTLIQVAGTDDVASAYAATYPVALVAVVLASQFIVVLLR
ncbi:MAG: permease [Clostridiales bacterium]|nr:permease [Clostridiales bacterium]